MASIFVLPIRYVILPNGFHLHPCHLIPSPVTWVDGTTTMLNYHEHFVHQLYKPLVNSSLSFGAQRWLGTLGSQCERKASVLASIPSSDFANIVPFFKETMVKTEKKMYEHLCCDKQPVKKGYWSEEEDEMIVKCIAREGGHGNWNTFSGRAGLQSCGKSCRLRWVNYLSPGVKHGGFSTDEATRIVSLHKIYGNKWAKIAKHLPGRTDNEIKNY